MKLTFNPSPLCGMCGKWLNLNFPHLGWLCNFNPAIAGDSVLESSGLRPRFPYQVSQLCSWICCISPFWAWLSQLSNNRCIFNILGFLLSMFRTLICFPTFVCQLTVKFYRALVCPMQVTLLIRQDFPLRDSRRNKLQYLVHFSDQVKVL